MFLDYDGTLSPIVQDPDKAFMAEDVDPPPPPPSSSSMGTKVSMYVLVICE